MTFADGTSGLLIAAAEPVGRPIPLTERLASLVDSVAMPAMVFTPNGALAGVNDPAKRYAALLSDLTGPGFDDARSVALRDGQSVLQMEIGRVTVHRVGSADATALVALIGVVIIPKPVPKPVPVVEPPPPEAVGEPIVRVPHDDVIREQAMEQSGDVTPVNVFESVFDETPAQDSAADNAGQAGNMLSDTAPPVDEPRDEGSHPLPEEHPAQIADEEQLAPQEALPVSGSIQDNFPQNVVPFPIAEPKPPVLTAVESNAFDELARRLSARLEGDVANEAAADDSAPADSLAVDTAIPEAESPSRMETEYPAAFMPREPAVPRANSVQDTLLLDRLSVGVLVYRLDRLIYANSAFLASTGYDSLHALSEAGGLDALTVEPGAGSASSTSETGTPVVIAATSESGPDKGRPADARLYAITWDGEPAHALVFSGPHPEQHSEPRAEPAAVVAPVAVQTESSTQAEELAAILDTIAEGVVIFDGRRPSRVLQPQRRDAVRPQRHRDRGTPSRDLFAPESQRAMLDYLESVKTATVPSLIDHGREMPGRMRDGGLVPLSVTMGRTRPGAERFFAIFRDLSQAKKTEGELMQVRRQAERATTAKADILGRISHEVRMPLNAIIGFSDVMIDERFGALSNERYAEYLKDIRASGQRVMAIIDDLLDLSRIESGKMELSFASQDLNSMVEQCVAVMQPQPIASASLSGRRSPTRCRR